MSTEDQIDNEIALAAISYLEETNKDKAGDDDNLPQEDDANAPSKDDYHPDSIYYPHTDPKHIIVEDNEFFCEQDSVNNDLLRNTCQKCGNSILYKRTEHAVVIRYALINDMKACAQCHYLEKLNIELTNVQTGFTANSYSMMIYGIMVNPVFWIWIPFLTHFPFVLLIAIILLLITCFVSFIFFYPSFVIVRQWLNIGKKNNKYCLVPWYYPYWLVIVLFILNITTIIELSRAYFYHNTNIVYQCYFGNIDVDDEGFTVPPQCIVYLDLIGNASIVMLSTLFVNIAIIRYPLVSAQDDDSRAFDKRAEYCQCCVCYCCVNWKTNCGYCCKEEKEEKQTTARLVDVDQRDKSFKELTTRSRNKDDDKKEDEDEKLPIHEIIDELRRSYAPNDAAWNICRDQKSPKCSKLGLVGIVAIFCLAVPLSSLYTHPEIFFDKISKQPLHLISLILSYGVTSWSLAILMGCFYKLNSLYMKAYALMKISGRPNGDIQQWWDLRNHIIQYELPYYYELTNPILSVEVVGSIILSFFFVFQFYTVYDGEYNQFLSDILRDNVRFSLFAFTVMIIGTTWWNLSWTMAPYKERHSHIDYIDAEIAKLKFKLANTGLDSDGQNKFDKAIALCQYLKGLMEAETLAPKLLGIELNDNLFLVVRGYLVTVVVAFAGTLWQSMVLDANE